MVEEDVGYMACSGISRWLMLSAWWSGYKVLICLPPSHPPPFIRRYALISFPAPVEGAARTDGARGVLSPSSSRAFQNINVPLISAATPSGYFKAAIKRD
ncbi:hypothetical protein BaRGS_00030841 [Batillaria attramentaria]|uniref:Uncharacterized protein n=1 Tax=Batillaria attramentaria TaxID=370345 RepID=A0ABD0JTI2_9CAEN